MIKRESIKRGSIATSVFNIAARGIGFLSVFLIAYYFGANDKTDVYYFMLSFIALLSTLFTSLQTTVFLPLFIKLKEQEGEEPAWKFVNSLFTYTLILALVFSLAFMLFSNEILHTVSHFSDHTLNSSKTIITLFTPILAMMILVEFLRTIIFAHHQFTFPAITVAFNNILMVILILIFGKTAGVQVLAYSVFCSYVLQCGLLIYYIKNNEPLFTLNFKLVPHYKEFFRLGWPIFITQIFGAFSMFFYDYTATMFSAGTLTALSYANRIATLPTDMIITPVSQVVSPLFSENMAKREYLQLTDNYFKFNTILWLMIIPLSVFFIFFSAPIVELLFKRGNFTAENAAVASISLKLFSIGLFGYSLNAVSSRVFLALQKTLWISFSSFFISILSVWITYIMIQKIGFQGISLSRSTSIVVLSVGSCILFSYLYVTGFKLKELLVPFIKITICAGVAGAISFELYKYLLTIWTSLTGVYQILNLGICSLCYIGIYTLLCSLFKIKEFIYLIDSVSAILKTKMRKVAHV